jgi:hypothetical protein
MLPALCNHRASLFCVSGERAEEKGERSTR